MKRHSHVVQIARRRGYTLLELLTVLAVLAVLSTIGMSIFYRVTDLWHVTSLRNDLNASAVNAFEMMRRDFGQTLSAKLSGVPIVGERRLEEKKRYGLVQLEDDRVTIQVQSAHPETGRIERFSALYKIDREAPVPALVRTLGALGANPPAGARQVVVEGVLAMRLEYYDGMSWQPEWKQAALPEAVRATLVMTDKDRPWEQISRQAEFAIHVK
jgi:type II secretion system protein J